MKSKTLMFLILPVVTVLHAAEAPKKPYKSLVDNSPFLTPAFKARLVKRDKTSLNFIGYTRIGKEWHLALIDKKSGKTHWLKLNEEHDGLKVETFDEKAKKIHVSVGGIGYDLGLVKE